MTASTAQRQEQGGFELQHSYRMEAVVPWAGSLAVITACRTQETGCASVQADDMPPGGSFSSAAIPEADDGLDVQCIAFG